MTWRPRSGAAARPGPAAGLPLPPPVRVLAALIERLPRYPPSIVAAVAANLWLGEAASGGLPAEAVGRTVTMVVRDAGLRLTFSIEADGIVACGGARADVTISAGARDFLALALRRADPDTLFFSRRLVIEGDTALGHLLKNTLDAVEPRTGLPTPAQLLHSLRRQFARPS